MTAKSDIKMDSSLPWNRYRDKPPEEAMGQLYADTLALSEAKRKWYWVSIKTKRLTSLTVRSFVFLLLIVGTALPLLAGLSDAAETRLMCTQIAVTLLAAAGLLQVADKIFGWSSGWMRYITTVTDMEAATNEFDIGWLKYLIGKPGVLEAADVKALFALSEDLEEKLMKLQVEETNKWVSEFNAGLSLLDSLIKSQREETQKQLDALKTTVANAQAAAKADDKAKADADAKLKQSGAINIALIFKSEVKPTSISLDDGTMEEFLGSSWSKANILPGLHTIEVRSLIEPKTSERQSVIVEPGSIAKLEFKLPL